MVINEDEVPVNNIGSGNIAGFDPLLKVPKKKLKRFKEFVCHHQKENQEHLLEA